MGRVLGGFQDQVARQLIDHITRQRLDGKWQYTLAEAAREEAGFEPMETSIWRSQNTVAQYIATRSLLYLCEVVERNQGAQVRMCW